MANSEYSIKINDYEQFIGALTVFENTLSQSCCQTKISKQETTMFNKWSYGKSDLFTSSVHLDEEESDVDDITIFIPNVKKFILVLKNVGKYYDIKDSTLFESNKIKLSVCSKGSYIRISSPKYNIKFQLSTNAIMESQLGKVEKVNSPSKYGGVVHQSQNIESLQENFLLTANIPSGKFAEVGDLLTTLSESNESSIKIQIPEQAKIEEDVVNSTYQIANTLYATISDNQKLVKSNIGNKVSVEFGKMTYASPNYKDICCLTSAVNNFVFLCDKDILDLLASITKSFTSVSKAKDIEMVISKPNLIHMNLNVNSNTSKSEIYVTVIGKKASVML